MRGFRLLTTFACAAAASVAISACGDTTANLTADNEGIYVDNGHLKYQVQLSRQLNPYNVEDASYLEGIPAPIAALRPNQEWFGVFMRIQNKTARGRFPTSTYYITDTERNVYRPTPVPASNPFGYQADYIPAHSRLPAPESPASNAPTGGEAILFKIPFLAIDNRPLTLHIVDQTNPRREATVVLDV